MEEIWRIVVHDGATYDNYEVSNYGRIRSLNYNRTGEMKIMKPSNNNGYLVVQLSRYGKARIFKIHRLVAFSFPDLIPNDDPVHKTQINHIDENKENNHYSNLEWTTPKENTNHGTRNERASKSISKRMKGRPVTEERRQILKEASMKKRIKVVCLETGRVFNSLKEASEWCGKGHVIDCLRGKAKTIGGYHWQYYKDYILEINERNEQLINAA